MNRNNSFIKNGTILATATLAIRLTGVAYSAYLSNRIGAEITGLNSLINSVYAFALTLALSGVNIAATRLTAQAVGLRSDRLLRDSVRHCLRYALAFGFAAAFLLFILSGVMSEKVLGNAAAYAPLRILSFSLPFISVSSALNGYFSAVGRVHYCAIEMAAEQLVRIAGTAYFLGSSGTENAASACTGIAAGALIAESVSCLVIYLLYEIDITRHYTKHGENEGHLTKKLLEITMPVAVSSWLRTALRSAEHILIPKGLTKSGQNGSNALSLYGVINGMALMVVLFPATVLSSFTGLLVPELSREAAAGNNGRCGQIISKATSAALMFSMGTAAILFSASHSLGEAIFPGKGAGEYIMILSVLVPVMYMDTTVDFMLKGLGEQFYVMKVNILDSGLGVLFSLFVIPILGIRGYILSIFFSETVNAFLSAVRLVKCAELRIHSLKHLLFPFFSGICAYTASSLLSGLITDKVGHTAASILLCLCSGSVYFACLLVSECVYLPGIKLRRKKEEKRVVRNSAV